MIDAEIETGISVIAPKVQIDTPKPKMLLFANDFMTF
jgi:hypothetical protein